MRIRQTYLIVSLPCAQSTCHHNRPIVHGALMNHAATSRTIVQQIQSVIHHSVSTCTIRRHLPQSGMSAGCPLLRLPLTGIRRRLRCQWCDVPPIRCSD
ncbi:hypothetical protein TNCV_2074121 [Trichonephila clavipes]|nr:hypothetical protein TNCV_2074121 [Trichonephila clavipes]